MLSTDSILTDWGFCLFLLTPALAAALLMRINITTVNAQYVILDAIGVIRVLARWERVGEWQVTKVHQH